MRTRRNILAPHDTILDAIVKMAEGNPGAVQVLGALYKNDPLGIFVLDSYGIYGSDVWVLYKDLCHENLDLLIMALEAKDQPIIDQLEQHLAAQAVRWGRQPEEL